MMIGNVGCITKKRRKKKQKSPGRGVGVDETIPPKRVKSAAAAE
jgi:hypothetical protein